MNTALWIVQGILSLVFIMTGFLKIIAPKEILKEKVGPWVEDYSEFSIKTIGILEIIGSVGLVLPMLVNYAIILTPIAAAGLGLTMVFAAWVHIRRKEGKSVIVNFAFLFLSLFVLIGRLFLVTQV